jgi:hypothetical protein
MTQTARPRPLLNGLAARHAVLPSAALCLLAACATALPGPDAAASAPLPAGDGVALAAWISEQCAGEPGHGSDCREAIMVRITEERGIDVAMDAVARLDVTDSEGHALTHMIGIRGYEGAQSVGEAFVACTPVYQSGCYHGVIQSHFADLRRTGGATAITAEGIEAVCAPYQDDPESRWRHFQCLHGLGHGVMLVHDNHLPRGLAACDLLAHPWARQVCYGGAFMEHAMGVVAPHHGHVGDLASAHDHGDPDAHADPDPAAGHTGHAAHAAHAAAEPERRDPHDHHRHHGHHGPAADEDAPFPAVDPDDLHYPCSALAPHYRWACYDLQTSIMLHLLDGDIAGTAAACRGAPDLELRALCHRSLGRDINARTDGRHAESAALCALARPEDRPACHEGVVKNVIDVAADVTAGLDYCTLLPAGAESQACYRAMGEQTVMLTADPAARRQICQRLEDPHRQACLGGAGASSAER